VDVELHYKELWTKLSPAEQAELAPILLQKLFEHWGVSHTCHMIPVIAKNWVEPHQFWPPKEVLPDPNFDWAGDVESAVSQLQPNEDHHEIAQSDIDLADRATEIINQKDDATGRPAGLRP
jgi:hypothetical protein